MIALTVTCRRECGDDVTVVDCGWHLAGSGTAICRVGSAAAVQASTNPASLSSYVLDYGSCVPNRHRATRSEWIAIVVRDDEELRRPIYLLGHPSWAVKSENRTAVGRLEANHQPEEGMVRRTSLHDCLSQASALTDRAIPATKLRNTASFLEAQGLRERGYLVEIDQPRERQKMFLALPWRSSWSGQTSTAQAFGEAGDYVYREILSNPVGEIQRIRTSGTSA